MRSPLPGGFGVQRAALLEMSSVTHTTGSCLYRVSNLVVVQNCHHFHKSTQSTLRGGGDRLSYIF